MIYISAQPAEYYFLWQLEIQLQNFEEIGIQRDQVQVILSYKSDEGIPDYFIKFARENHQAHFFFYPDKRKDPKYLSSIRPHILMQHFQKFPDLEKEVICYHDSDIIFRERLNENMLSVSVFWYFSDTRNYVAASYLRRFGDDFFRSLCEQINIDFAVVELNESHSGGAQHIMKGVSATYWRNVEIDSEKIYSFIKEYNTKSENNEKQPQAWCADMWAVLWNAWKLNKQVRLHDELLFSWPKDHLSRYEQTKIFHNSGVFTEDKNDYFCKLLFKSSAPYDVDFSTVRKDHCSIKFVEQIQRLAEKKVKPSILNCTLIICLKNVSDFEQKRIVQYVNYLYKHLYIEIHLVELGEWSTFNEKLTRDKAKYILWHKCSSEYIKKRIKTEYFIFTEANILLPAENILSTIETLDKNKLVFPADEVIEMNLFQFNIFKDTLSLNFPRKKNNIQQNNTERTNLALDYVECFAMSKTDYIRSGGDNSEWCYFYEDGFNLERQARCRFFGYQIQKVDLPAYKIFPNESRLESEKKNSSVNYLKTCDQTFDDLKRQIAYRDYSFNKFYKGKLPISRLSLGVSALKASVDTLPIQIGLQTKDIPLIKHIKSSFGQSIYDSFVEIIKASKKEKLDFIILLNDDIQIKKDDTIYTLWKALEDMIRYGLQILSTVNGGGFKQERKLSQQLFWIDTLPASPMFIIHNSLFDSIISFSFDKVKSIENNLNNLTNHIGVVTPFIGLPNFTDNGGHMLAHIDRIKYIKRIEDRLKWILKNE